MKKKFGDTKKIITELDVCRTNKSYQNIKLFLLQFKIKVFIIFILMNVYTHIIYEYTCVKKYSNKYVKLKYEKRKCKYHINFIEN